jgi:gas vesicle protein
MMREMKSYDSESSGGNGFLMGVVCGAAVGAAVGLLLAPKAGAELRHQLYDASGRLRRRAAEGYNAAAETVSHVVDDVAERANEAVRRGKETYENIRHTATEATNDAAAAASRATNSRI